MVFDDLILPNLKYSSYLKKLIQPLVNYIGAKGILITDIENNDRLINLASTDGWLEHCFANEYYNQDPFMVSPKFSESGSALVNTSWESTKDFFAMNDKIIGEINSYGLCQGIYIARKSFYGIKIFFIYADKDNLEFMNLICKNMALIDRFINYIDKELNAPRKVLYDFRVNLKKLKGAKRYNCPNPFYKQDSNNEKIQVLQKLGVLSEKITTLKFTPREKQCVNLFLNGNSASSTGNLLNISQRTVESHIDSVKGKLFINNKLKLYDIIKALKEMNLF